MFDQNLRTLSQRAYLNDMIEGKFSSLGQSYQPSEMMLLFAGLYFTQLVPSKEIGQQLCLVQVQNMIKFEESVYHALEFIKGKILVSLWQAGFIIVDKASGSGLMKIKDPLPANINNRGFIKLPGFDIESFPFVLMRGNLGLSLINVKVGFCQTLVQEKCDLNWYQSAVALTQAYDQAEFSLLFLGKRDLF